MTKVSVSIGKTKDEDALGFPKTKLLELVPHRLRQHRH